MCILTGGRGEREQDGAWKKAGDRGTELVNPSPACLPVFVRRSLQPKETNAQREKGGWREVTSPGRCRKVNI